MGIDIWFTLGYSSNTPPQNGEPDQAYLRAGNNCGKAGNAGLARLEGKQHKFMGESAKRQQYLVMPASVSSPPEHCPVDFPGGFLEA